MSTTFPSPKIEVTWTFRQNSMAPDKNIIVTNTWWDNYNEFFVLQLWLTGFPLQCELNYHTRTCYDGEYVQLWIVLGATLLRFVFYVVYRVQVDTVMYNTVCTWYFVWAICINSVRPIPDSKNPRVDIDQTSTRHFRDSMLIEDICHLRWIIMLPWIGSDYDFVRCQLITILLKGMWVFINWKRCSYFFSNLKWCGLNNGMRLPARWVSGFSGDHQ